jgi:hypothetical protein
VVSSVTVALVGRSASAVPRTPASGPPTVLAGVAPKVSQATAFSRRTWPPVGEDGPEPRVEVSVAGDGHEHERDGDENNGRGAVEPDLFGGGPEVGNEWRERGDGGGRPGGLLWRSEDDETAPDGADGFS